MHIYPEPFLFMHTTALCMELVEDWSSALKAGILVSASSPLSMAISWITCQMLFHKPEQRGERTRSELEQVVWVSTRTLGNFWFFRRVCRALGSDDAHALEMGMLASGISCVAEQTIFHLEKRHTFQLKQDSQNNIRLPEEELQKRKLNLEENSKRVEVVAFAILAGAVSLTLGYPWRVSVAIGAVIGSMTLVDSFIQQTWSPNYRVTSLYAIVISGRIAGGLVSSML